MKVVFMAELLRTAKYSNYFYALLAPSQKGENQYVLTKAIFVPRATTHPKAPEQLPAIQ